MKIVKSALSLLVISTLTGCGDDFACDNPAALKAVNEVIISNALNERDFRTFRPYGQAGLTSKAVTITLDNPIAIDSNPNVKSLTCKVHLTARLSDDENSHLKQRIDDITQKAMKEPSYQSNKGFIANVNKAALDMAKTKQVTGTVEYTLYPAKGQVVAEVNNTPEASQVIRHVGDDLLRPMARVYAAQNGALSLTDFYSIDIMSMFRAR